MYVRRSFQRALSAVSLEKLGARAHLDDGDVRGALAGTGNSFFARGRLAEDEAAEFLS